MMYGRLWSRRLVGAGLAATLVMAVGAAPMSAQTLPGCQVSADFAQIVAKIGASTVGDCVAAELSGGASGDRFQSTSRGLLIFSGAGNWTAFTDGQTTWINDPSGTIATATAAQPAAAPAQQNPGQIPPPPGAPHPAA